MGFTFDPRDGHTRILHDDRSLVQHADSDGSRPGFRDDLARHSDLMSLAVPR